MAEQFESLTLTAASGPGQSESVDPASLPRPVGEQLAKALAPQPPADPGNCSSDNMRMTVNAIPISTALRARQVARGVAAGAASRAGETAGLWEGRNAGLGWSAPGLRLEGSVNGHCCGLPSDQAGPPWVRGVKLCLLCGLLGPELTVPVCVRARLQACAACWRGGAPHGGRGARAAGAGGATQQQRHRALQALQDLHEPLHAVDGRGAQVRAGGRAGAWPEAVLARVAVAQDGGGPVTRRRRLLKGPMNGQGGHGLRVPAAARPGEV